MSFFFLILHLGFRHGWILYHNWYSSLFKLMQLSLDALDNTNVALNYVSFFLPRWCFSDLRVPSYWVRYPLSYASCLREFHQIISHKTFCFHKKGDLIIISMDNVYRIVVQTNRGRFGAIDLSLLTFFYWPFVVRVITRKLRSQQLFIELF